MWKINCHAGATCWLKPPVLLLAAGVRRPGNVGTPAVAGLAVGFAAAGMAAGARLAAAGLGFAAADLDLGTCRCIPWFGGCKCCCAIICGCCWGAGFGISGT